MNGRSESGRSGWPSRLLVSLFVLGVVAFLAVASVADIRDVPSEDRTSAALFGGAAWLISFAAGAALTFLHARRGTLILRERAAREANRQRIRAMNPTKLIVPGTATALTIGYLSPSAELVWFGLLGGCLLAFTPVILWVAVTNPGYDTQARRDERTGTQT